MKHDVRGGTIPTLMALSLLFALLAVALAAPASAQGIRDRIQDRRNPPPAVQPVHECAPTRVDRQVSLPSLVQPTTPFRAVAGNQPPAIRFRNPVLQTNEYLPFGETACIAAPFTFQVDTSDADGRVVRVEYYFEGPVGFNGPALEFLGASTTPPFTLDWRGPALAVREGDEGQLVAFAFDDRRAVTSTGDDFPGDDVGRTPAVAIDGAAIDGSIAPGTGGFVTVDDYPGSTAYDGDSVFRHEIEQGINMVSPDIQKRFAGGLYSGTGSYGFGAQAGSFMEWPVFVSETGTYRLSWRFANERGTARPAAVSVDGVDVGSVSLRPTGASDFWRFTGIDVRLEAGTNRIRLRTTGPGAGAIDYLTVRPG